MNEIERGWEALRKRCCADPEGAKRCVMVSREDFAAAIAAMRGEPVAMMGAKEISAAALLAACESDPADPEHPDTICITTGDLETIVRCAVQNWVEGRPTPPDSGKD